MSDEPRLADVLHAAGAGLGAAQAGLVGGSGAGIPTTMAVSEAELEIKATLSTAADGSVGMRPVSAAQMAKGAIPVGLVSTVTVRFVPVAGETAGTGRAPVKDGDSVIAGVRGREDLKRLERIFGALVYDATFVPERRSWLVGARDAEGRDVRTLAIPDEE